MNRRAFSLLEVSIVFSLLALLLSTLFFWYRNVSFDKKEISDILPSLLEERYADIRLSRILPKIKKENGSYFFTEDKSLTFIFDNGPQRDPLLSDAVKGYLYLNSKEHTLCLDVYPHPESGKEDPKESYTLLDGITDLSFDFYFPPPDPKKIVDPQSVGDSLPRNDWQKEWKKTYKFLPVMMKVIAERPLFFLKESL